MNVFVVKFVVTGLLFALIVRCFHARKISFPIRVLLSGGLLFLIGVTWYFFSSPFMLSSKAWYESSPTKEILLYLLMILGMLGQSLNSAISERSPRLYNWRKKGKQGKKPPLEFDTMEKFVSPMICSCITFGAVLTQLEGKEISFVSILLCLQTGFMYQSILVKKNRVSETG